MIVVIAGMPRSGSTYTFNVARELLQMSRRGVNQITTNDFNEAMIEATNQNLIIKSHFPDETLLKLMSVGAVYCVCSYRSPEDAIASWMRTFDHPLEESIETVKTWLQHYEKIKPYALTVSYSTIDELPLKAILQIAFHLKIRLSLKSYFNIWIKYRKKKLFHSLKTMPKDENTQDMGFTYFNKDSYFHRRHINAIKSEKASDLLSYEELNSIRQRLYK